MSEHVESDIQRLLAEDADVAELGIEAVRDGAGIVLRGQVSTAKRRYVIADRVGREFPDVVVRNEITVAGAHSPGSAEETA